MLSIFTSSCTRCILHKGADSVCIPASGPDDADIMFMGEAPGADEDAANKPFVGPAGQELNALLKQAGLSRKIVRVSNIVRCRPPANRTPNTGERNACSFYTVQEINEVQPKVIVALGGSALKALTGVQKIGDNRGKMLSLLPDYRSSIPVLATYHPAAYLHQGNMKEAYSKAITEDMRLAKKIVSGDVMKKTIITSYSDRAKLKKALRKLSKCKVLACDLEWEVIRDKKADGGWPWSQRNGRKPREMSIAVAGEVDGHLLAVALKFTDPQIKWVRKILAHVPTIYHYGLADLTWLYHLGWEVKLGGDTHLLASLCDIDMSKGLKVLAPAFTEIEPGWGEDIPVGQWPRTPADWKRMLKYNGKDAIATFLLEPAMHKLLREQKREAVLPLYEHVLLPAVQILSRTALNGVPVDEELLARKWKKLRKDIVTDTERIGDMMELPGSYEAVIGKPEKMAPFLENLGFKLGITSTGKPSVTRDILLQNKKVHKVAPLLIKRSKMVKREDSYYRPWTWMLAQQQDGRLHTTYRLTNARTGRTSAESEVGNTFQQTPRDKRVRKIIKARPGWGILDVDQSQIEMRHIAWKSRDPRMLQFFREGKDLHKAMAGFMKALGDGHTLAWYLKRMDKLMEEVNKKERDGAKPINFGLGFGGGPKVIITTGRKDYGITFTREQAQMGYNAYHQFYPRVKPWQETFWEFVDRGYSITDFGRYRIITEDGEGPEGMWRKHINTPTQAFASDLSLFCQNFTWEILLKEYGRSIYKICENIGFFHDATLLHIDMRERDLIEGVVLEAWEHPPLERLNVDFDVPLVADITVDSVWT